jgi:hypothetical protein
VHFRWEAGSGGFVFSLLTYLGRFLMSRKEEATDDKVVNEYYHMKQIATRNI